MSDLLRSNLNAPSTPLNTRKDRAQISRTAGVLGKLAELGSQGVKLYTAEHQTNMVRRARNDMVNGTINGDLKIHEAAYAQEVAKNTALSMYNNIKAGIDKGDYRNMKPNAFQSMLEKNHTDFKAARKASPFSDLVGAEYDNFTLDNEATLVAGQSSSYRKELKGKQRTQLYAQTQELVRIPKISADQIIQAVSRSNYTMVSTDDLMDAALTAGGLTNNIGLLKKLNTEFNYDTNPAFAKKYAATINKVNKHNAVELENHSKQDVYDMYVFMDNLESEGNLYDDQYKLVREVKDSKGDPVYTQAQFRAKVKRSKIIRAGLEADASYTSAFKKGVDISDSSPKTFKKVARAEFTRLMAEAQGNTVIAYENMGRYLVNQTHVWKELKDHAGMFDRIPMMLNNEANPDSLQRYEELAAFERGVGRFTDGDKTFSKYMGDGLIDYLAIREELKLHKGTPDEAWAAIASSLELRKAKNKRDDTYKEISTAGKIVGTEIAQGIIPDYPNPLIPDFIEKTMYPIGDNTEVAEVAALAYDTKRKAGYSDEAATAYAKTKANSQVYSWGGETYNTRGIDPKVLFGTSDPEGAFRTMMEDPEWSAKLTTLFGQVFVGGEFVSVDEGVRFSTGIFSSKAVGEAATEEEHRKAKEAIAKASDRIFLDQRSIQKSLNIDTGMLEFRSEQAGGLFFSIPLRDIGTAHNAKLQGIEELDRLGRLYDDKFQGTVEGQAWAEQQNILNNKFSANILDTSKAEGRTNVSNQEYVGMPDEEKTRIRKQFYKDNYEGVLGRTSQVFDFFNLKREADTAKTETVISKPIQSPGTLKVTIGAGIGVRHNNPGNMIYIKGMMGASKGELKGVDIEGNRTYWAKYKTPEAGFKGLVRQIGIDEKRGDTLTEFLRDFAPKIDNNNTTAYIRFVAGKLGVTVNTKLSDLDNTEVAKVVAAYESKTTFK